ncbi:MAG: hypothetical protein IIX64_04345 [Bacteroidales bacterium]|nr:hypothetical protein [Bacteroidales bacterium]
MKKKHLYIVAALLWGLPGVDVFLKGILAYRVQAAEDLWWLLLISLAVITAFFFMFRKIVDRYSARIAALPSEKSTARTSEQSTARTSKQSTARVHIWQTFPLRGWIMIFCMMGLGIILKHLPDILTSLSHAAVGSAATLNNYLSTFTASFYCGLGPMLIWAALRFLRNSR